MKKNLDITKPPFIANTFSHSLGASLYQGSTVTAFIGVISPYRLTLPLWRKDISYCIHTHIRELLLLLLFVCFQGGMVRRLYVSAIVSPRYSRATSCQTNHTSVTRDANDPQTAKWSLLKSIPLLYFSRDYLRLKIIRGPFCGSFASGIIRGIRTSHHR